MFYGLANFTFTDMLIDVMREAIREGLKVVIRRTSPLVRREVR